MDYNVQVQRYWRNWFFCWHGREQQRLLTSNNGVVSFCGKCGRKRIGIHDFGSARFDR